MSKISDKEKPERCKHDKTKWAYCADCKVDELQEEISKLQKERDFYRELHEAQCEVTKVVQDEAIKLRSIMEEKDRFQDVCNQLYRDKVKPIRHLWPNENNPGIGQIVTAFTAMLEVLEGYAIVGLEGAKKVIADIEKGAES